MRVPAAPTVVQMFLRVLRARRWIAAAFVLLTAAGIYGTLQVPNDPSIERLVVAGDPVALATRAFDRIFPEGEQALLMLETVDPLGLAALSAADRLEHELARIPQVEAHSFLDIYRHAVATGDITQLDAGRVRAFASGTPLFRRAGLLGDHYLGIALELRVKSPAARDQALQAIDALVLPLETPGGTFTRVRRVGSPWLNAWLERQTGAATARFMPLFGIFLMTLVLVIYRSWRTLAAFVLTLGAVVAVAMGLADLFGWTHTVISTLVPLTVLVTTTATLVYVHSRYIEPDDSPTLLEHHARALANKFLPCSASMFATAVGFGALAISDIRPVHDMGLWTACGLLVAWSGCFTLFPALQSLLRTPMRAESAALAGRFAGFVDALLPASKHYRWSLVGGALVLMLCGAAALFGIPGVLAPPALETDALTYVNPSARVAEDTRYFEESNALDTLELWLQTPPGHALDPQLLRALEQLTRRLESDPRITAVDGPTSVLRWARYAASGSDQLPTSPAAWPKLAADLEQIMLERARRPRVRRPDAARQCASHHPRTRQAVRPDRRHAHVRGAGMGGGAGCGACAARGAWQRRGPGGPRYGNHAAPAADTGAEFRAHRQRHLSRLPGVVSQSQRPSDDDDPVAVRDPVRVSPAAPDGHPAQYRDDPHRLDDPGGDRERPDSLLLSFPGRPLERHDGRRPAARIPDSLAARS